MSDVTKSGILFALKKVEDPDFNKDHLLLNSIKNVDVKKDTLTVIFVLPIPSSKLSPSLKEKFTEAIKKDFPAYKGSPNLPEHTACAVQLAQAVPLVHMLAFGQCLLPAVFAPLK